MKFQVIPSLLKLSRIDEALRSPYDYVLLSQAHIGNLRELTNRCHAAGKRVMVNSELVGGLGSDRTALEMLEKMYKSDAVIDSSVARVNMMKSLKLESVWRVPLVDSLSVETALKSAENVRCDFIEVRPCAYALQFMKEFDALFPGRVIVGGFVNSLELLKRVKDAGARGVSTSTPELWSAEL